MHCLRLGGTQPDATDRSKLGLKPRSELAGLTFGGGSATASAPAAPSERPSLLIDYAGGGGCAGIVAANATDVRVQNLILDAYRAPFTVGRLVGDGSATSVSFTPEAQIGDRPGLLYRWNSTRWPVQPPLPKHTHVGL